MIVAEIALLICVKAKGTVFDIINKQSLGMSNKFWKTIALVSGIYIFIPEVTDVIPVIGWLDEATAFGVMVFALKKLGYDLKAPFRKKQQAVQ